MSTTIACQCGCLISVRSLPGGMSEICPQCGTLVAIPDAAASAVDGNPFDFLFEAMDDSRTDGPIASSERANDSPKLGRRECHKCHSMIVETAAKCRFCGQIFDSAALSALSGESLEKSELSSFDITLLKEFQRGMRILAILSAMATLATFVLGQVSKEMSSGQDLINRMIVYYGASASWAGLAVASFFRRFWASYGVVGL